MSVLSRSY